jgi:DNA-binding response OmpR family regulator
LGDVPLSANSASPALERSKTIPWKWAYAGIPLLLLLGVTRYFRKKKTPAAVDPHLVQIGAFRFDQRNMTLTFEDERVDLSHKEAELLTLLHQSANATVEREVLLQKVWGDEGDYVGRTLDVYISKLRKKLEADASVKIVNIRGVGYKLVVDHPS